MNELYLKYRKQGVFRKEQLIADFPSLNSNSLKYKLRDAKKSRLVKSVSGRRGIYFIVEPEEDYKKTFADTYKLAANLAKGTIICYASALSLYGKSHSIHNIFYISAPHRFRELRYNGVFYKYVTLPYPNFSIEQIPYKGVTIKVTSLERTLVDCLRNLKYAGGFEQLYHSFEGVQYLNYNKIEKCLVRFSSSVLNARVGLFLEFFKSKWGIQDALLNRLQKKIPSNPDYFLGREYKVGKLIHKWNLMVPEEVLNMGGYNGS
jgi:predicted transcriptional regulator of viral defense system